MKIIVVWSRKEIKITNKIAYTINVASKGTINSEKYQGDAREILNEKRKVDQQLVVANSEQNRSHTQLMMLQVLEFSMYEREKKRENMKSEELLWRENEKSFAKCKWKVISPI